MGLESGWAHALGCPEWGPPGVGPQEGVLPLFWGRCGGVRAAVAQYLLYLQITMDTYTYMRYLYIHAYTCRYMCIPTNT